MPDRNAASAWKSHTALGHVADERFMRMTLSLARRGWGSVSPNPMVGCIVVDPDDGGGRVVSWGYHERCGEAHAEVRALEKAGPEAKDKTIYVNLEPCCHTGRTPPCCDALIRAEVGSVVAGSTDPNPLVAGGGLERLRGAGIPVRTGVLETECKWLNRGFIRSITLKRPWVTIKAAVSLDGDMALSNGESKWISGASSRKRAHLLRAESDAVMVGIGTVTNDDPALDVRDVGGRSPLRVVVDRDFVIKPDSRLFTDGEVIVFTGPKPDEQKMGGMEARGVNVKPMQLDMYGHIPVASMLAALAEHGVNRLLVEGGAGVIGAFLRAGLADELSLFVAPKLMGRGLTLTDGISFRHMGEVITMKHVELKRIGDDIWYEGIPACSPDL